MSSIKEGSKNAKNLIKTVVDSCNPAKILLDKSVKKLKM